MSYQVETRYVNLTIPGQHIVEAYNILLTRHPELKKDEDTLSDDWERLNRALEWIGFDGIDIDCEGGNSLILGQYCGATRDEENDFRALAHLIPTDDYIEWMDQDGDMCRWLFKDGELIIQNATITWV